jgi:hypothetical protein
MYAIWISEPVLPLDGSCLLCQPERAVFVLFLPELEVDRIIDGNLSKRI